MGGSMWYCMGREYWTPRPDMHLQLSYDTWGGGGKEGDGVKEKERKRGREKGVRQREGGREGNETGSLLVYYGLPLTLETACRWWCQVWHRGWPD